MTIKTGSQQSNADQIAIQLDQGLKSCRAVLDDYRVKLSTSSAETGAGARTEPARP